MLGCHIAQRFRFTVDMTHMYSVSSHPQQQLPIIKIYKSGLNLSEKLEIVYV
jgi:hypothetical protein